MQAIAEDLRLEDFDVTPSGSEWIWPDITPEPTGPVFVRPASGSGSDSQLPFRPARRSRSKDQKETAPAGPILVVEDDPDILTTVVDILEFESYSVEKATNGRDALKIIERVRPSLILLDMRMPIIDGWTLAGILKDRGIHVPILVMTAAQDAAQWAEEIGADGYIAKPFDLHDLLDAVARFQPPPTR